VTVALELMGSFRHGRLPLAVGTTVGRVTTATVIFTPVHYPQASRSGFWMTAETQVEGQAG